MVKALKPLIVVLLLLSITSLILGIMLFGKRDVLKQRNLSLHDAVVEIADNIRFDELEPEDLKNPERMDGALNVLAAAASAQYDELQFTKTDLEQTKDQLVQTEKQLQDANLRVDELDQQVASLQDDLDIKEAELAQATSRSEQLEQEKATLQIQIDDLNDQLVQAEEFQRDLEDQLAALEQTITRLEGEIGVTTGGLQPSGISGNILVVNSEWNFVILDVGESEGLQAPAEMLVHRDERFIGKVRVSEVKENMAVAEILRDWEQLPIQKGDYVLF